MNCILCYRANLSFFHKSEDGRIYHRCSQCGLVFLDPSFRLDADSERKRYQLHENQDSVNYRQFLSRLALPLMKKLSPQARGLDYGAGPQSIMEKIFLEQGFYMRSFDPFFYPDKEALNQEYQFITCSEVAEHFYRPREEFERLFSMLEPGGYLALMTDPLPQSFASWHYHRDPTHVAFYSPSTMEWVAEKFSASHEFVDAAVTIFRKN